MPNREAEIQPGPLISALEYLLNAHQQQLAEALSEISHRGDREWTRRLRNEVDETNRLLQMLRSQQQACSICSKSNSGKGSTI